MRAVIIRFIGVVICLSLAVAVRPGTPLGARASAGLDDWPMFLYDVNRSSFNPSEVRLSAQNAQNLKVKWKVNLGGPIVAQPIVVGDSVYIGAWDGYLYALDRETGTVKWKVDTGKTDGPTGCYPSNAGITSAPAVVDGVVYIGGGGRYKYAFDAATGTPIWRFDIGDNSPSGGAYNWDSPAVFNGKVYSGVASFCDRPFVPGRLWALDRKTGQVDQVVNFQRPSELGGGIWTSPSIDPATGAVYATTASAYHSLDYSYCIVVCDPKTLQVLSAWQIPPDQQVTDGDWSTTPTIFKHSDGRTLVGAAAKNGKFYAFDSNRIGDGPIWTLQVAEGGECPNCGEGTISSAAYAYGQLFIAGGHTTVRGQTVGGSVRSVDPSTGRVLWESPTAGAIFGSVVTANHLVAVAADNTLHVLDASDGRRLWSYDTDGRIYGAPTIAGGVLYAGTLTGALYAFSAGPYAEPTATPVAPTATPAASPTPQPAKQLVAPPLPGDSACFSETGQCLHGVFLGYWRQNGGLDMFGFPITSELLENGRTVQYTQRARFEYHPENQAPYNVLLGRLGAELTKTRTGEAPFAPALSSGGAFVPETGHNMSGPILSYWQANGGIPVFGYPLSEPFTETSPTDRKPYLVQYFERQRLEYHPENTDPHYKVLLGLLGAQSFAARYAR